MCGSERANLEVFYKQSRSSNFLVAGLKPATSLKRGPSTGAFL